MSVARWYKSILSAGTFAILATALSGCIDSAGPILPDSQPILGQRLKLQFFSLRKGFGRDPAQAAFTWNGALYAHADGGATEVSAFSVHPFEAGDFIIEAVPAKRVRITEYALLHKIADGVFQVLPIDEEDADEPTRVAYCGKGEPNDPSPCRIQTRDQLFAFARATAARRKDDGGLVIRLPDGSDKAERPAKRRR